MLDALFGLIAMDRTEREQKRVAVVRVRPGCLEEYTRLMAEASRHAREAARCIERASEMDLDLVAEQVTEGGSPDRTRGTGADGGPR